jgi:predicted nucleotidyltransferase
MGKKKTSIADALFSKVKQKVLGILYGQPNTAFFTNEIIRLSHSGTGAVQRELDKLATTGLVTVTLVGNQKRYQANQNNPIFEELCRISLKTFGMSDVIKEMLTPIKRKITLAFIYGSVAKNEETANSDIDLMLIGDNLNYADCFKILNNAEEQLGRKINPTIYTPADWKLKINKGNNFVHQVIKQPKIFLMGKPEQLNELN